MAVVGSHGHLLISFGSPGKVGLALSYAAPIVSLLGNFLTSFTETEKELVSVERVLQYMDIAQEELHGCQLLDKDWPLHGDIEFAGGHSYPLNDAAETVNEIGSSIRRVMGGTSGIIYDIFCKAAYSHLKANSESVIKPMSWADALESAIAAISKYGGASAGYRTMLDALIPAASVLKERLTAGDYPVDCFVLSSEAALSGAEATKNMQAQAGRSSYVPGEILASVPDPGAMAAAAWYRAAALAVNDMK